MAKKMNNCCSNNSFPCCFADIIIGIGIGALMANLVFGIHPIKWGIGLVIVGILAHLYPKISRK